MDNRAKFEVNPKQAIYKVGELTMVVDLQAEIINELEEKIKMLNDTITGISEKEIMK